MANYPADGPDFRRTRRPPGMPSANRYLPPLGQEQPAERNSEPTTPRGPGSGERITVTRAAAMRSREMGSRMYWMVQRAATADGADKSGLTALTWPVRPCRVAARDPRRFRPGVAAGHARRPPTYRRPAAGSRR